MKRLAYLLFIALLSGMLVVGCAGESSDDNTKGDIENTENTTDSSNDDMVDDDLDMDDSDESDDSDSKAEDRDNDEADDSDNTSTVDITNDDSPEAAPVTEENFDDDFSFDDIDEIFDDSPDPDASEFVKVDQEAKFLNESEVRAAIKAPYANASGKVYAKILVGLDGRYRTHFIRRSPDKALSKAVVKGMEQAKFKPAMRGGEPVKVWVDFFHEFK